MPEERYEAPIPSVAQQPSSTPMQHPSATPMQQPSSTPMQQPSSPPTQHPSSTQTPSTLPLAAAGQSMAKPELASLLSTRSLSTVHTLTNLERDMEEMRTTSQAAAQQIEAASSGGALIPVSLRGDLCTLHGSANKMLATRIDAIMTSDLISGKEEARAKRKALVTQAEHLIETVEAQILAVDQLKGCNAPESTNLPMSANFGEVTEERT